MNLYQIKENINKLAATLEISRRRLCVIDSTKDEAVEQKSEEGLLNEIESLLTRCVFLTKQIDGWINILLGEQNEG